MEFGEKLLELRKKRGLTQEELAKILYISRTAVSKWESGRGYPGIDSLKEIANYFSVSIDDLLSGEKLLSLAQTENRKNIHSICDLLFSAVDLFSVLLIILPLYPNEIGQYIYSVNLLAYNQTSPINKAVYLVLFVSLFVLGVVNLAMMRTHFKNHTKILSSISLVLSVSAVVILAVTRQVYAVIMVFLFFVVKVLAFIKRERLT